MLKIAVCDDEYVFAKKISSIIAEYLENRHVLCEIDIFESGKEFVKLGIELMKYKAIFLDVNMEGMDGIETAKAIRTVSENIYLVFVTAQ